MASSLSNLVNNLSEGLYRIECKLGLKYTNYKNDLIKYKCLVCNKKCQTKFDEKLKEKFSNSHKFSHHDRNKFILILQFIILLRWLSYEYKDD